MRLTGSIGSGFIPDLDKQRLPRLLKGGQTA
jgi:hypothetical protein